MVPLASATRAFGATDHAGEQSQRSGPPSMRIAAPPVGRHRTSKPGLPREPQAGVRSNGNSKSLEMKARAIAPRYPVDRRIETSPTSHHAVDSGTQCDL